jgi:hypothetical protein
MRSVCTVVASLLARRHIVQAKREMPSPQPFRVREHVKMTALDVASLLAPQHIV